MPSEKENPAASRAVKPTPLPAEPEEMCNGLRFGPTSPWVSRNCLQHVSPSRHPDPKGGARSAGTIHGHPSPPCPGRAQNQISDPLDFTPVQHCVWASSFFITFSRLPSFSNGRCQDGITRILILTPRPDPPRGWESPRLTPPKARRGISRLRSDDPRNIRQKNAHLHPAAQ